MIKVDTTEDPESANKLQWIFSRPNKPLDPSHATQSIPSIRVAFRFNLNIPICLPQGKGVYSSESNTSQNDKLPADWMVL
jgi:hypothetical protein